MCAWNFLFPPQLDDLARASGLTLEQEHFVEGEVEGPVRKVLGTHADLARTQKQIVDYKQPHL